MIALMLVTSLITEPEKPTVAENFQHYCQQSDASEWFCKDRAAATIPDSQKWDIVAGYCFDDAGSARPVSESQLQAMLDTLKRDPSIAPRAAVCEEHRLVPPPLALEFNHRTGHWSRTNKGFEAERRLIELDPVGLTPIAHLASKDSVGIIVTDTNPMLFVANRGDAKEENIDQVKGLESLLALLGPALQKAATDITQVQRAASRSVNEMQALASRGAAAWTTADRVAASQMLGRDVRSLSDNTLSAEIGRAETFRIKFRNDLTLLKDWIAAANTALDPVKLRLQRFLTQRARLQSVAQRLDRGPATLEGDLDRMLEDPSTWTSMFQRLSESGKGIPSLAGCISSFDAYVAVVSAKAEEPVTVFSAATKFTQFFNDGSGDLSSTDEAVCEQLSYDATLLDSVKTIQDAARGAARDPGNPALVKALREAQADGREQHLETVLVLQRFAGQVESGKQGIKETVAKEEETRKASLVLGLMGARARDAGIRLVNGHLLLTNRIFVEDEVYSSAAMKMRITPLKVAINSQYVDSIPTDRPKEVTTSYKFVRRGFDRLSFGVGILVVAPAFSATYVAVDPDPSRNTSTTTTTTVSVGPGSNEVTTVAHPELKVIREKEKQVRSGSYATFVNERMIGSADSGIGAQFGVAISAENPAFLFGFSINLTRYATLGTGAGYFRVKQLAADQAPDTVRVLNTDEIRLETSWTWTPYVSLSVNLSGFALFK